MNWVSSGYWVSTGKSNSAGGDDFVFCREDASALNHDNLRKAALYWAMDKAGIRGPGLQGGSMATLPEG